MTTPLDPNIDRAVFITTVGRLDKQFTYGWFTDDLIQENNVRIICPKAELKAHEDAGRLAIPCPIPLGLPDIRQWLMEYAYKKGLSKVILIDDDFTKFYVRKSPDTWKLRDATKKEVKTRIIERIFDRLDEYAMVGLSHRSGNNRFYPATEMEMVRMFSVLSHRVDIYHDEGLIYNRVRTLEDFDMALQLIEKGYPTLCITDAAYGPLPPNTEGGCSIYRDNEFQRLACEELHALHPDAVRVVKKVTKVWAGGGMAERYDVVIHWKKSLCAGVTE